MNRLVILVILLFAISSCAPYKSSCQTRAGKKKLEYYNSIQYKKSTKFTKKNNKKRRVAWSY